MDDLHLRIPILEVGLVPLPCCVSLTAVPLLVYRPDIREPMTAVLPVVRARRSGLHTKVGIIGSGAEVRPCFKCKRIDLRYLSPLFPDA